MSQRLLPRDKLLFGGLILLIIWAPLPLGSAREWSSGLLCIIVFLLTAVWLVLYAHGQVRLTRPLRKAAPILVLWVLFVLYVFLQAKASWAAPWAPLAHEWYGAARDIGIPVKPVVSVDAYATLRSGYLSLALFLFFCLSLVLIRTPERLRTVAYALVISGVFQSCYGIIAALAGNHGDSIASGTYVNRNHFAGYLEMTLAVGIGMLAGSPRSAEKSVGWRDWLRSVIRFFLSEKAPLRICILIMALGLILSRSRMGNSAFMGSLTGVALIYLLLSHGVFRTRLTILWVSILILDVSFLGSYFGLKKLTQRIEGTTTEELDNRVDISNHLEPYVRDFLPFGSGLGTFRKAFTPWYTENMKGIYVHAENDYLQFVGELGVGAIPLAVIVVVSVTIAVMALRRTEHIFARGMSFAAVMAIVSILIHSTVDFNLQMPANALTLALMLALCWLARYVDFDKDRSGKHGGGAGHAKGRHLESPY